MIEKFKGFVRLSEEQYQTLKQNGTITEGDITITYDPINTIYITPVDDKIGDIIIDSELSPDSENPVQNKAIYAGLNTKVTQVKYSKDQTFADGSDAGSIGRLYMRFRDDTDNSIVAHTQAMKYTVPVRDSASNFYVGDPTQLYHTTNKKYVDGLLDTKLDKITTSYGAAVHRIYAIGTEGSQYIIRTTDNNSNEVTTKLYVDTKYDNINDMVTSLALEVSNNSQEISVQSDKINKNKTYDLIIKTQEDFDAFFDTLLDGTCTASSVLFVGDGGTTEFIANTQYPMELPDTLFIIDGVNNPIIHFPYARAWNRGCFHYATKPSGNNYRISNLTIKCTAYNSSSSLPSYTYAFTDCVNLSNCTAIITGTYGAIGFLRCDNVINCRADLTEESSSNQTHNARGFVNCNNLTNCKADLYNSAYDCQGFYNCTNISNAIVNIYTKRTYSTAFYDCDYVANYITNFYNINTQEVSSGNIFNSCRYVADKLTPDYDSGWFSYTKATTYTFTHNLGTMEFLTVIDLRYDTTDNRYFYHQGCMTNSDGTSSSYAGGLDETSRTTTQIFLSGAKNYALNFSRGVNNFGDSFTDTSHNDGCTARVRLFKIF